MCIRDRYYSEGPAADLEMGHRYIGQMMNFYGITDFDCLIVEGHNANPEKAEEIKADAIERAKALGQTF